MLGARVTYHIQIVPPNANYGHGLDSLNFGIQENVKILRKRSQGNRLNTISADIIFCVRGQYIFGGLLKTKSLCVLHHRL